jgi:alpha-amylase
MTAVCFYFQVHQPFRLRKDFNFFSIGSDQPVEDEERNREICLKVANKCYLPANELMLRLIDRHRGDFRISYSISGVALEQFERYAPHVLTSFQRLAATGCVEFIGETYFHSLAFLFSVPEFKRQVLLHQQKIKELFGFQTKTFRNTELITNNALAKVVEDMGFDTILAEGADRILHWRSPNYVYQPQGCSKIKLLLKNYRLSDDIAFRFSNQGWNEWPLTADKFAKWVHQVPGNGYCVNLFMDYETFGEHQWESTGIFKFLDALPSQILAHSDVTFRTPSEVSQMYPVSGTVDMPDYVSWADTERDTSAWLGNPLQDSSAETIYGLEAEVLATKDDDLIAFWRRLQTSDHLYYMCIKWFQDGDVHKYFSPYNSPYDAFLFFSNAMHQLRFLVGKKNKEKLTESRTGASAAASQPNATLDTVTPAPRPKKTASAGPKTSTRRTAAAS